MPMRFWSRLRAGISKGYFRWMGGVEPQGQGGPGGDQEQGPQPAGAPVVGAGREGHRELHQQGVDEHQHRLPAPVGLQGVGRPAQQQAEGEQAGEHVPEGGAAQVRVQPQGALQDPAARRRPAHPGQGGTEARGQAQHQEAVQGGLGPGPGGGIVDAAQAQEAQDEPADQGIGGGGGAHLPACFWGVAAWPGPAGGWTSICGWAGRISTSPSRSRGAASTTSTWSSTSCGCTALT